MDCIKICCNFHALYVDYSFHCRFRDPYLMLLVLWMSCWDCLQLKRKFHFYEICMHVEANLNDSTFSYRFDLYFLKGRELLSLKIWIDLNKLWQLNFFFASFKIMYFVCVCVCVTRTHLQVSGSAHRAQRLVSLWSWSYRELWATQYRWKSWTKVLCETLP